nr:type II toxin-antitoxin system PemK/MazF family toxin [Micromonospora sp. DSM 115978]
MRPIHLAQLDKPRPVLILTREAVRPYLTRLTVAPITSTIRGLSTEVPVGPANGLDRDSVVNCDNVVTVPKPTMGRRLGYLLPHQEAALAEAILAAFALDLPD